MRVKICGLTRLQDAELALSLGATELGFIFAPSPRKITLAVAQVMRASLGPEAQMVGVFADQDLNSMLEIVEAASLNAVQLHGRETAAGIEALKLKVPGLRIIKAIPEKEGTLTLNPLDYKMCAALLFDSSGSHFMPAERRPITTKILSTMPFYLAGGLSAQNILSLIDLHQPYGVDLSSGVESSPGIKDPTLLKELFSLLKDSACLPQ